MAGIFKFKKYSTKTESWKTQSLIGEALNGKLIEQVTNLFCPQEVIDVIDQRTEELYRMGFEDAVKQIRDGLIVIEYEGD
jgi:hypothetical protein